MVVAGHSNRSIAKLFAVGGMSLSLIAGVIYAMLARDGMTVSWSWAASSPARSARC
jgi:hypothetical protein